MYRHLRLAVRLAFFGCLAGVLFVALNPHPFQAVAITNDKGQHFIAFLVLSGLGKLAWPSVVWGVAIALVAVGGTIEVLQGTPLIGRDMSFLDWVADSVGVVVGSLAVGAALRFSPVFATAPRRGR
jgi:VanZ family protein